MSEDEIGPKEALAKILQQRLAESGLSVIDVARRSALGRTTVSQALNGSKLPSPHTIAAIGRVLGIRDVAALLDLRRQADPDKKPEVESLSSDADNDAAGSLKIDDVIVIQQKDMVCLNVRVRNSGKSTVNITRAAVAACSRRPFPPVAAAYMKHPLVITWCLRALLTRWQLRMF